MARNTAVKTYNTFVKGLITEADALTFPDNASLDELNCIPSIKGNRRRRLGIDYEQGYTLSTNTFDIASLDTNVVTTHTWETVSGNGDLNFLVIQISNKLYFHDLGEATISAGEKSFSVDLDSYLAPGLSMSGTELISVASGKGVLFVSSKKIDPFYISYNLGSDNITVTPITIQIRDFTGVDDGLSINNNPVSLSSLHQYNLQNQGWNNPPGIATNLITQYHTSTSTYPNNAQVWWVGKDSSDNFDPALLSRQDFGNTPAPKGHYILNAFRRDRSSVSGVAGITVESDTYRPQAIEFFAGRVFYAGISGTASGTNIYFSQILFDNLTNAGYCYQDADPCSQNDSTLVDSDGGVISIPQIGNIKKIFTYDRFLIILADNGLWAITADTSGFTATSYDVLFVSKVNCLSTESVINVEGLPVWWSSQGIFTVEANSLTRNLVTKSLSLDTIQTYYDNNITATAKLNVSGEYDKASKRVTWIYKEDDTGSNLRRYDRALIFDVRLSAFYPWKFSNLLTNSPYIGDVLNTTSLNILTDIEILFDGTSNILDTANDVEDTILTTGASNTFLSYLTIIPNGATSHYTFSELNNRDFFDWVTKDTVGVDYSSYIITGYELGGDIMRNKQIVYLDTYLSRTETEWSQTENGDYILINPSSCFMQAMWDWTDTVTSNRWSSNQQVYRFNRMILPDANNLTFDNGFTVIISKNKVRGYGKALSLKFSSDSGKDFDILGWAINVTGNTRP